MVSLFEAQQILSQQHKDIAQCLAHTAMQWAWQGCEMGEREFPQVVAYNAEQVIDMDDRLSLTAPHGNKLIVGIVTDGYGIEYVLYDRMTTQITTWQDIHVGKELLIA